MTPQPAEARSFGSTLATGPDCCSVSRVPALAPAVGGSNSSPWASGDYLSVIGGSR
jgi:hypothetical protein